MIYVGDIGTAFIVDTGLDLSSATSVGLFVERPSGDVVFWEGEVYASGGKSNFISYKTILGDLNRPGTYKLQAFVVEGARQTHGQIATFAVDEPLPRHAFVKSGTARIRLAVPLASATSGG